MGMFDLPEDGVLVCENLQCRYSNKLCKEGDTYYTQERHDCWGNDESITIRRVKRKKKTFCEICAGVFK